MPPSAPSRPIKYIADLSGVREVLLTGTADLAYWKDRLRRENLEPLAENGRAKLLINATSAQFMGIPFRELNLSVFVRRPEEKDGLAVRPTGVETECAYFLAHAYNSSRFFAFVERNWFGTPYHHARIEVEERYPADVRLWVGGEVVFDAGMFADSDVERAPLLSSEEMWEGPIYLPRHPRRPNTTSKLFHARLSGHTKTYAFVPSEDTLILKPRASCPLVTWLAESNFCAETWSLRSSARHARGKTNIR